MQNQSGNGGEEEGRLYV